MGKIVFLAALYGFIYTVFRGLVADTRLLQAGPGRGAPGSGLTRRPGSKPVGGPVVLHPPAGRPAPAVPAPVVAPVLTPPPAPTPTVPAPTVPAVSEPEVTIELAPEPEPIVVEPEPEALGASEQQAGEPKPEQELSAAQAAESEPAPEAEAELPVVLMPAPEPVPEPVSQAALVVLTSPEASLVAGERIPVSDGTTIGRADTNDIVLKDRFVSSHHARVIVRGDQYLLEDLGSTNGTFCNGVRVRGEVALQDKDRVGIGTSVFAFRL